MKDHALAALKSDGVQAAMDLLNAGDDPVAVMDGFNHVALACYNDLQDVAQAVMVFETGIAYGEAAAAASTDDQARYDVMSKVKALNYNLGANTWIGWGDDVSVDAALAVKGGQAAARNLALAHELDKGDLPLSRAHWLVGAHALAAGELGAARAHFEDAVRHAAAADADGDKRLASGYTLLARELAGEDMTAAWAAALDGLRPLEYGDFYIGQLETARRIFSE